MFTTLTNLLASILHPYYGFYIGMNTVTVSPKFQVVIPRYVREELSLRPGEKMRVIHYQNRVEFIPVRPIESLRGISKGMDTSIQRDEDRL